MTSNQLNEYNKDGCPFLGGESLPIDGTPLSPSPKLAEWREFSPVTSLKFNDGHEGWIVTNHDLALKVLEDSRFSQLPQRFPGPSEDNFNDEMDDFAQESLELGSLLALDAQQHARIRRSILGRFSLKSVRSHKEAVSQIVAKQLSFFKSKGSPANLTEHYAEPISTAVHSLVLGIPDTMWDEYSSLYIGKSTNQQKIEFIRKVLAEVSKKPRNDVLSDLVSSDLSDKEVEGLTFTLFSSGRDSVAYMIATSTLALLTHPDQLEILKKQPELISNAIEEFMRFGSMFVTLFPRTALEDIDFGEVRFKKGQSVSVSQVAANRDEQRFAAPNEFDISRDAFGHIGFGHGIHGCVGQQLARLQIQEGISQLFAEFPNLYLVEAEQAIPQPFAHPVATYEAGQLFVGWD